MIGRTPKATIDLFSACDSIRLVSKQWQVVVIVTDSLDRASSKRELFDAWNVYCNCRSTDRDPPAVILATRKASFE